MTQTSKAAAKVTFRVVPGRAHRVNIETGVQIAEQHIAGVKGKRYAVLCPTRDGFDVIEDELTFAAAREWATERVELMRENIAEAYDAAAVWIEDELNAAEMAVVRAGNKTLTTTYNAAWRSLEAGFLSAANARLFRVLGHFHDAPMPSDEEVAARLADAQRDFAPGTEVLDQWCEVAVVEGPVVIDAETGIPAVMLKYARGYANRYTDTLTR